MKLSEAIERLTELKMEFGDLPLHGVNLEDELDDIVSVEVCRNQNNIPFAVEISCLNDTTAECPICGTLCLMPEDDGGYICENQECQHFFELSDNEIVLTYCTKKYKQKK